jgi:hypothetical protein
MSAISEAAVEGVEVEVWASDQLPNYQPFFNGLYNKLVKNGASKRPVGFYTNGGGVQRGAFRAGFRAQGGGNFTQMALSTASSIPPIPRGTASTYDSFVATPFQFLGVTEIASDAIAAVAGGRGKIKLPSSEMEYSSDSFMNDMEGLIYGDASGTIDTIPSTGTVNSGTGGGSSGSATYSSIIGVNAALFTDQMVVSVFPSVGGATRGTFTVSFTDPVSNTIYSTTVLPSTGGATAVGDILVVQGGTGAAGSSVYGLKYWHRTGNTGTMAGITRANYPGRLSTPTLNANGQSLPPSLAAKIEAIRMRASGDKNYMQNDKGAFWYVNPAQGAQFASDFYNKYTPTYALSGETVPDLAKGMQKTFLGEDCLWSTTCDMTRADRVRPKDFIIGEAFPMRLKDFGENLTIVPVPAQAGGYGTGWTYLNSKMFAWEQALNLICVDPKSGFYISSLPTVSLTSV